MFQRSDFAVVSLMFVQAANTVLFKKVSAVAPHAAFTLTMMQPLGTVAGFGVWMLGDVARLAWLRAAAQRQRRNAGAAGSIQGSPTGAAAMPGSDLVPPSPSLYVTSPLLTAARSGDPVTSIWCAFFFFFFSREFG
jgi:hypothetical protein